MGTALRVGTTQPPALSASGQLGCAPQAPSCLRQPPPLLRELLRPPAVPGPNLMHLQNSSQPLRPAIASFHLWWREPLGAPEAANSPAWQASRGFPRLAWTARSSSPSSAFWALPCYLSLPCPSVHFISNKIKGKLWNVLLPPGPATLSPPPLSPHTSREQVL